MSVRAWSRGLASWRQDTPRLLAMQLALLDRNVSTTMRAATLAAWLTAGSFLYTMNDARVIVWAIVVTVICTISHAVHQRLPRPEGAQGEASAHHYRAVMGWICLAIGCSWGALPVLFLDPTLPASLHLILVVIAGVSSAGMVAFGPVWPLALIFWLSCMMPLIVALMSWQDPVMFALGLFGVLYLLAMATYAYHTGESVRRALSLRLDNEDLVQRLREQSQQAQDARAQAEQALGSAEEADRAKALFLASASHDLRQPLHAAGLFLGSLARSGLNARQAMLLEHAQASNSAASEMLNTLLDFSKVDAGMVQPRPQSFALQPLFHKLERELGPWAADKQLNLRMRDTQLTPFADPGLVELILRNLLLNAIRYTEHGGVLLACRQRAGQAVIEVWDTGIGIPLGAHQTIFQAFQQLNNPERDRRNGLGLGLAIVHGLAQAMGVFIDLRSRPGKGSVFRVHLPLGLKTAAAPEPPRNRSNDLNGLRVLLVDDDEGVRLAMADLMEVWGVQCQVAASIEEALDRVSTFSPDVVLADYRLRSAHTGVQALAAIRLKLGFDVPAALVTGDTATERFHDAQAHGFAVIHKPVPAIQLHALLRDLQRSAELKPGWGRG